MVKYELQETRSGKLIYFYYPEGDENKIPGEIEIDMKKEEIKIVKIAELDFEHTIPVEEVNGLIDAINQMECESGGTDFVEHEEESIHSYSYGSHAMNDIANKINSGIVPQNGICMWY